MQSVFKLKIEKKYKIMFENSQIYFRREKKGDCRGVFEWLNE